MGFRAAGGGDIPESVNQALHESVTKISWSKDKKTLKLIFLVGDAPPHMDYPDDVKYPVTCKLAVKNDIIINTVQCGKDAQCMKYWKDICQKAEGSYIQIGADGGPVVVVATPFDKDLAKINAELARSTVAYGGRARRAETKAKADKVAALPVPAAAERAGFAGKGGFAGGGPGGAVGGADLDLVDGVKSGKVKLKDVKAEDLPEEMQKMTPEQREAHLKKLETKRADLNHKAAELDKKRSEYIIKKQAEDGKNAARDSFDNQVLTILQRQARRHDIRYETVGDKKK
jgi:hypothetical protein